MPHSNPHSRAVSGAERVSPRRLPAPLGWGPAPSLAPHSRRRRLSFGTIGRGAPNPLLTAPNAASAFGLAPAAAAAGASKRTPRFPPSSPSRTNP